MAKGVRAIQGKLDRLINFQKNADRYAIDAIMENKHIILDMNFEEQLYMGVNSENIPIMSYEPYHPLTVYIKDKKNQPSDRVTLRDTGDFYSDGVVERIDDKTAEIGSTNIKTDVLTEKYGKEIFGLTDDNMAEIRQHYVKPHLTDKLTNG